MMFMGLIVVWLTFPGVIVHELAHALFCKLFGLDIYAVKYFQFATGRGQPAGYVVHAPSEKTWQNILVSIGPFFVNTILGAIIGAPAAIPVLKFGSGDFLDYFLIYMGVSIAMHAFPSTGDAAAIWHSVTRPGVNVLEKVLGIPLIGLIYLGSLGSFFWLDLFYGIAVAGLLPNLLISLLA